jgi:putative addiction module CopG family antidote
MPATRSLRVTLLEVMAEMVKAKVESGEYASESEVVGEGLRALQDRDDALTRWLKEEVAAAYDEYQANPSDVVDADEWRRGSRHSIKRGPRKAEACACGLFIERRVTIAFTIEGNSVIILGVFYGGQDYETALRKNH